MLTSLLILCLQKGVCSCASSISLAQFVTLHCAYELLYRVVYPVPHILSYQWFKRPQRELLALFIHSSLTTTSVHILHKKMMTSRGKFLGRTFQPFLPKFWTCVIGRPIPGLLILCIGHKEAHVQVAVPRLRATSPCTWAGCLVWRCQ